MVHHIVMWKFKPEIEENKKEELKKAMEEIELGKMKLEKFEF